MNQELDSKLCEKYPKIFKDRYADMQTTAMCWGPECGDGWFNIIDLLCGQIQGHIDWSRGQRADDLRYNRALKAALAGDDSRLIKWYTYKGTVSDWALERVKQDIARAEFRTVTEKVTQVVAEQVKEKFGTLRFYYRGGDEYIHGLAAMAEAMSARTCEGCGAPGKANSSGWIKTMCQTCLDNREQQRQQELAEYNAKHEDVYKKLKENTDAGANGY